MYLKQIDDPVRLFTLVQCLSKVSGVLLTENGEEQILRDGDYVHGYWKSISKKLRYYTQIQGRYSLEKNKTTQGCKTLKTLVVGGPMLDLKIKTHTVLQ